ncbi:MAG TPA: carboxypeptidase regulatory-like domain-containing protein, partial [Rhizomicrobium sp.]
MTIRSRGQGFTRSASTSASGGFYFSGLPSGAYEVTVEADGYRAESIANARVSASAATTYSIVLRSTTAVTGSAETVVVTGTRQTFDFTNTTTGATLNIPDLVKDIPVSRDLTSIILLAPGTVGGDRSFGRRSEGYLPSIGGSSVAENAYYINGLNITDFNHYTGGSLVPFDFYESVEVKTGGYPAEFGRATGGVVNAVSKSGSNEFKAAVHVNWEPDALRETAPDTYTARNKLDHESAFNTVLELGGPIIKDHLFFYGLMQLNQNSTSDSGIISQLTTKTSTNSPFWGAKIDGYITDDHHLEFTYFNTKRITTLKNYAFDAATDETAVDSGLAREEWTGGESWVAKYTGRITDWLTISAAYGDNRDRDEQRGGQGITYIADQTVGGLVCGGITGGFCGSQNTTVYDIPQTTKRTFYRVDVDVLFNLLGDHHVRFGMDNESNYLAHTAIRPGPEGYAVIYRQCATRADLPVANWNARCRAPAPSTAALYAWNQQFVEFNFYNTGGEFRSRNTAFYVQDEWKVLDNLTVNLGVRIDGFNNFTADGSQYVALHGLFAPRAGFSYSPWEDDSGRFYGSFGDYYLPVAGNTAFRQGARELYFQEYWFFNGLEQNNYPSLTTQLVGWRGANACPGALTPGSSVGTVGCTVTSDGSVQDPTSSLAKNLKATREQEIIFGYEQKLDGLLSGFGDLWTVGINYTRRDLMVTAEDGAIDAAVNAYCDANGIAGCSSIWSGFHQYVIINP